MIRKKSISQMISAFALMAVLTSAGPLSARPPESASAAGQTSVSLSVSRAQANTHALLFGKLCELNENWVDRCPDFEILADAGSVDGEVTLIQTHLKLVISQLRSADVGHLSEAQLAQRLAHLQTLQSYMANGVFPKNIFVAGRRPVFIDPWGTHCAVGHLIATSGNSQLADTINREHQLDFLRDIKTDGLLKWQHASGLSVDELALIQPTYRSTTLKYPEEIENLILGDSKAIVTDVESGELKADARCGGKTLLHFAAAAGDLALVKLLVDKGADLHAVSTLGCDKAELAKGGSQTVVTVRWNQSTSVTNRSGLGIGTYGAVFKTQRGQLVANIFHDLRGGRAGMNALDYATVELHSSTYYPRRIHRSIHTYGHKQAEPENDIIKELKEDRAAVASWLEEQGLKATK